MTIQQFKEEAEREYQKGLLELMSERYPKRAETPRIEATRQFSKSFLLRKIDEAYESGKEYKETPYIGGAKTGSKIIIKTKCCEKCGYLEQANNFYGVEEKCKNTKCPCHSQNAEFETLRKGYEEVQMVNSSIEKAYPEAYRLARKFHELYEETAPGFGYITNPNTKEFYPNSNNGRLMAYVCYNIVSEEKESALALQKTEIVERIESFRPSKPYPNASNGYKKDLDEEEKSINKIIDDILNQIK